MAKKMLVAAMMSLSMIGLTGGIAHAADPAGVTAAPPGCTDLRNGRLCITITPVNQNGRVVVSYEKKSGSSFIGHLEWENPAGRVLKSPDIQMVAGGFYYHTWPTWVGPGRNRGIVYNKSAGESSYTPYIYPR